MLKHNDSLENKEKVKYDLYKILRMSILLNRHEVDKLTLDKFREASLNIDRMLGEDYDEKIESMFYETATLEDEEERLKKLVNFITDRIEKRKSLLEDYRSVTNRELVDLDYINKSGDLDLYEKRLKTIKDYLDNSKLIEVNEQDLENIKESLVSEFDIKASNEIKNVKLEENLSNVFINSLYEMDLHSLIESSNIDGDIEVVKKEIKEAKEQKDTFEAAFDNLKLSGISGDLELEYASYVENAKRNYYYVKEKEIILKVYKLIEEKESDYINLSRKREDVKKLLEERINLRRELGIKDKDLMSLVYDLILEQNNDIDREKENVDNINILTERIKLKESRLEELRKSVKQPEVLAILKEYSLIDIYDHDDEIAEDLNDDVVKVELKDEVNEESSEDEDATLGILDDLLPVDDKKEKYIEKDNDFVVPQEIKLEIKQEKELEKEFLPNQIKESLMVPTMNFGLSRLKSISVMKRVGDMLGINAKSSKVVEQPKEVIKEPEEVKLEPLKDLFIENDNKEDIFVNVPVVENPFVEEKSDEDLFWTPNEFFDMKNDLEPNNESEPVFIEDNKINGPIFESEPVSNDSIFEFKMPEMVDNNNQNQIFKDENVNNGLIFPEPVMPELNVLPENKEDKFVWPENMETFDINGIFPN